MKTGFYAGSFDPFTNGHLQVIKKSTQLFDRVVVGIGVNPKKSRRFDEEEMQRAIEEVLKCKGNFISKFIGRCCYGTWCNILGKRN